MTNRERIVELLARLNQREGMDLELDSHSQGLAICAKGGSRTISMRLPPKDMVIYLRGFEDALDEAYRRTQEPLDDGLTECIQCQSRVREVDNVGRCNVCQESD